MKNKADKVTETVKTKKISEEKLVKELKAQAKVAKEILQEQEEKSIKIKTNPSAIALSTTKHDAGEGINTVKKTVRQLYILYLTNQFVSRAINVRADTLISRGHNIVGEDEEGVKACEELIENSGGTNLFWQTSVNTDIAGDGFLEKIYNQKKNKILELKHVHPLTLSFKKDKFEKILVDKNNEPIGYVQHYLDKKGLNTTKDVSKEVIQHLRYNTLGDEFTGISAAQSGYNTIVRLMNMEYSAAESAVKIANPIIVGKCNTKSPSQIALWGQVLGNINGQDQIFIPDGMELSTLAPGNQNFSEYADYFLNAVVASFGVPKGVLLGDTGGSGNRAEGIVLTRHFYSLVRSLQKYQEDFFNKIFAEYGKIAGFKPPKLMFDDIAEDATLMAESAIKLLTAGIISVDEAREMIGLESSTGKKTQGVSADLKQSDKKTFFPETPGKVAGSQKGIKAGQKTSGFSEVKPGSK